MPNSPDRLIYYAIGDVHGEADRLLTLHDAIFEHHELCFDGQPICIVHLGDYVDRGPDSCGVIDAIMALETRAETRSDLSIISLMGNHERMMLNAFGPDTSDRQFWLANDGDATVESYERQGRGEADLKHLTWMKQLPLIWHDEEAGLIFVHAGVSPDNYPDDREAVYLWTRSPVFFDPSCWTAPALDGMTVIHGHTPTEDDEPDLADGG